VHTTAYSNEDLLNKARLCDAVYVCPKVYGVRKGPLVAYAGKDDKGRNFVGDIYFNFRRIESFLGVVEDFALAAIRRLEQMDLIDSFDTICGIPHGGRTLGQMVAQIVQKRYTYADKQPLRIEPGKKQEFVWDLSQFQFEPGERVAVVEDVFNNFQNTDYTLAQIAVTRAEVVLLAGALNRSLVHQAHYMPKINLSKGQTTIPVVAAIQEPFPEYSQDHPDVVKDVQAGNVEFEVKKNWKRLCSLME
jgi:orotate phosphoribosyltransferase